MGCFEPLVFFFIGLVIAVSSLASAGSRTLILPVTPAPTGSSSVIPASGQPVRFADPAQPNKVDPAFALDAGISDRSRFDVIVNPGMLTIVAGPADLTGASACYRINGDFAAQVYARAELNENAQGLGLFVRSPGDWRQHLGIVRRVDGNVHQLATPGRDGDGEIDTLPIEFLATGVFLKIERNGDLFTLSYQDSMRTGFEPLQTGIEFELPAPVEICLNVWSGDPVRGVTGAFGEFFISVPPDA